RARDDTLAPPPPPPAPTATTDQKVAGGAPDVSAGGPALSDTPRDASSPQGAPPPPPGASEGTTGELVDGKPSTGRMGAPPVAPVQSYPQDPAPAPAVLPSDAERASDPDMIGAFREAGDRPAFSDVGEPYLVTTTATGPLNEPDAPLA